MAATQGPKTGTYIIDNPIVLAYAATTGPAMSAALRAVFRELARYADPMIGIARPTLEHLAGVLDLSRQTVAKDLRDLECLGLITIRQAEGFSGKRSEYYFPAAATGLAGHTERPHPAEDHTGGLPHACGGTPTRGSGAGPKDLGAGRESGRIDRGAREFAGEWFRCRCSPV